MPPISIGPVSLEPTTAIYYLIWGVLAAATILIANLLDSREGRAIRSLRGGVVMVESLGISVFRIRLVIFVIAALLAGLSGWLYAHMSRYVSPAPFDLRMGIQYLFMAILGGSGHILGAVVGAALITLLQNGLQDCCRISRENGQQLEVIVFAIIYVLALQFARGGVMPFMLRYLPKPARQAPAVAEPLPRRAMPQAGIAAADGSELCEALRRPRSGQPRRLRGQSRRNRRPDRPERRRQEHSVQSRHRRAEKRRGHDRLSSATTSPVRASAASPEPASRAPFST